MNPEDAEAWHQLVIEEHRFLAARSNLDMLRFLSHPDIHTWMKINAMKRGCRR